MTEGPEKAALADRVAEKLEGTCVSLEQALELLGLDDGLIDDGDFCHALDARVFCCEDCGWWCGPDEQNDRGSGWVCDDCL